MLRLALLDPDQDGKSLTRLSYLLNAATRRPGGLERASCSFGRGAAGEGPTSCYANDER